MTTFRTILLEDQGPVRLLTLNQPEMFNPLDEVSGTELVECLEEADRIPQVRALVLTGAGKAFAAGGNVRRMAEVIESGEPPSRFFRELTAVLNRSVIALRRLKKPVICALNGVAAGGGLGWALGCDLVVASEKARFEPGYIRIAVNPDGGAAVLIPRLIGLKRATDFFMRARVINAREALDWGMVNEVVAPDEVLPRALELAQELAQGPAEALASTKALLNQAALGDLETILEEERREIIRLVDRPDFAEGIRAFFEKRPPKFQS